MIQKIRVDDLALQVLHAKVLEIRDVDNGEEPFLYSSGNWGPGYVAIKNLVGRKWLIKTLTEQLALRVYATAPHVQAVAGNVTGGIIPGWLVSESLEAYTKMHFPFVYVRDTRKKGGHKERITGISNNPEVASGSNMLVVEELVDFSQTTCNSAIALRDMGYTVTHAACILSYENPVALQALKEHNLVMISLMSLDTLLCVAEQHQTHSPRLIHAYRDFLRNPAQWQAKYDFIPVPEGGTK